MHTNGNPDKPLPRRVKVERGIYQDPRTGRYEVYYMERGRQRWLTVVGDLNAAREERAKKVVAIARGERIPAAKTTVADIAAAWWELKQPRLRPGTAADYQRGLDLVVLPRFGKWKVAAVDADAVARLIRDLEREGLHAIDPERPKRPLGRSAINNYLKPLQGMFAYAVRFGMATSNPFSVLIAEDRPLPGERVVPHEWSDEELDALLAASARLAAKGTSRYDYTPLLRLVAALGLRKGEVLGLRWEDFDKDADGGKGVLHVRRQWLRTGVYGPTKTGAGVRRIELPPELRDDLIALRLGSRYSKDGDPVFASLTGTPLGHRNVLRRAWEPARDEAGLPSSLTFHDLRHAAASRMFDEDLNPVKIAAVLGHEDAAITLRIYGHWYRRKKTNDDVRNALAREGGR